MRSIVYLIGLLLIMLVGCSSYEEPMEKSVEENSLGRYLTNSEACEIASQAFADFGFEPQSRNPRTAFASLLRLGDGSRSAEDTTFYVVNFMEGGFVVISADRNVINPIYAISDEGQFSQEDENVQFFMSRTTGGFHRYDSIKTIVNPQRFQLDTIITYHDRFLPTLWSQGAKYNKFCPILSNGDTAAVGCVAVAMGQTLAYHRRPASIHGYELNWESILASKNLNLCEWSAIDQAAHLLRELGTMLNMSYTEMGSAASMYKATSVFKELGFSNVEYGHDLMKCIESLKLDGPVPMDGYKSGERYGHAWVADAAKILLIKHRISIIADVTEYYLHINWGAAGSNNGYYWVSSDYMQNDILGHNAFYYITGIN